MIDFDNILKEGITLPDGNNNDQYGNSMPAFTPENFAYLCEIINELIGYISAMESDIWKEIKDDYND